MPDKTPVFEFPSPKTTEAPHGPNNIKDAVTAIEERLAILELLLGTPSEPAEPKAGELLVVNSTNDPRYRAITGDVAFNSSGVATIANGAVSGDKTAEAVREALGINSTGKVRRGKSIIATEQSRESTSFGVLTTPDEVKELIVPEGALVHIAYSALWKESVANAARAAIFFVGGELAQGNLATEAATGYVPEEAKMSGLNTADRFRSLASSTVGLRSWGQSSANDALYHKVPQLLATGIEEGGSILGGITTVRVAPGTYNVNVQFRATSGKVTVKERQLVAWVSG